MNFAIDLRSRETLTPTQSKTVETDLETGSHFFVNIRMQYEKF